MGNLNSEIILSDKIINTLNCNILVKMKDLEVMLSMSRSQIDKLCKTDPKFPEKIDFGETKQAMVRFHYDDVLAYIESKRRKADSDFYQENNKVRLS